MNPALVWAILCMAAGLGLLVGEVFVPSGGMIGLGRGAPDRPPVLGFCPRLALRRPGRRRFARRQFLKKNWIRWQTRDRNGALCTRAESPRAP